MARSREELQALLEQLLGSRHVYFQPLESMRISYPCIIYEKSSERADYADNLLYRHYKTYKITVIDRDPDSAVPGLVMNLPYCRFTNHFAVNGLNHDIYELYF